MIENLIIWLPLIWIFFIFINRWKNKRFKFCMFDIDKGIYIKKIKRTQNNKSGKYSKLALFPKVLIYIIFLAIKCKSNSKNIINDMKNLHNHDFFTYESISVTNKINMVVSQENYMLLKIFYLKIAKNEKEHSCYFYYYWREILNQTQEKFSKILENVECILHI